MPPHLSSNSDVRTTLVDTVKVIKIRLKKLQLSLDNVQTLTAVETNDENGVLCVLRVLSRKIQIQHEFSRDQRKNKWKKDRHINPIKDRHITTHR